jgi:hypothetical protein
MSIELPWIQAESVPRPELGATYVKMINGDPTGVVIMRDPESNQWLAFEFLPNREGQLIVSYAFDETRYPTARIYIAVNIGGTLQWKICIPSLSYIDVNTGSEPEELKPLYSFP